MKGILTAESFHYLREQVTRTAYESGLRERAPEFRIIRFGADSGAGEIPAGESPGLLHGAIWRRQGLAPRCMDAWGVPLRRGQGSLLGSLSMGRTFYGWRIVGIVFLAQAITLGLTIIPFSLFITPLVDEFGLAVARVQIGMGLFTLVMMGAGAGVGALLDRFSIR